MRANPEARSNAVWSLPLPQALRGWPLAFVLIWAATFVVLLALPWPLETKALAALHGLCAQQPTHSVYFGDARLPFDSRMTGIYGGFLVTSVILIARGRWRAGGMPSIPVALTLLGFVALLGVDGLNSTARDFGMWSAYEPRNALRLGTGLLTGVALCAFVWLLVAQVGFARTARRRGPAIDGVRDLSVIVSGAAVFALVARSGWKPLWAPLTLLLVFTALAVFATLALAFVLLLTRAEGRALATVDLARPATLSLVVAVLLIGLLSASRFALEASLGVPSTIGGI